MKKILLLIFLLIPTMPALAEDGTALASAFALEVDRRLNIPEPDQARYATLLESTLIDARVIPVRSQYLVMVDISPSVQAILLYWIDTSAASKRLHFIGASPVSTGKPGQYDYFRTPTGVFSHNLNNRDFRAEGTFNVNGIRGLGVKGMRAYDFGWAMATRGWGDGGLSRMRLLIHATDPDRLEQHLGMARSKGCVRIPATLNIFIDRHGLLDADYQRAAANSVKLWVLRRDRMPTPWPGRYLVIVDSNSTERPVWSPKPGNRNISRPKAIH
jgi:hypothetical protein